MLIQASPMVMKVKIVEDSNGWVWVVVVLAALVFLGKVLKVLLIVAGVALAAVAAFWIIKLVWSLLRVRRLSGPLPPQRSPQAKQADAGNTWRDMPLE